MISAHDFVVAFVRQVLSNNIKTKYMKKISNITIGNVVYFTILAIGIVLLHNSPYPTSMYEHADSEFRFFTAYMLPVAILSLFTGAIMLLVMKKNRYLGYGGIIGVITFVTMWTLILSN